MKKIIAFGLGGIVLSFCLGSQNLFQAKAYIAATNSAANVVVGQQDMSSNLVNQNTGAAGANTLKTPCHTYIYGTKLFVSDTYNHRVLIYNTIPTSSNASADVVIGQANMVSNDANQGAAVSASTLYAPYGIYYNGTKLFVTDNYNNRVLIYNSLPSSNNASANVVVGQANMGSNDANQGGSVSENTLSDPIGVWADNDKLFVGDYGNNRVLVYNSIPTSNNASANVVVGQANMTSSGANQGTSVTVASLNGPHGVFVFNSKLYVSDYENNRVLVYNSIPTSNNTSADSVIGQADMTSATANRGGAAGANTLNKPNSVFANAQYLAIADRENSRILLFDNQDTTASPATLTYSNKKNKSKTVTLNFYGFTASKTKKKYYTVKIGGKNMSVKSVKKYSDRVRVKVKYKYGKKARGTYDVYLRYKYGGTINTRTTEDLITIQ